MQKGVKITVVIGVLLLAGYLGATYWVGNLIQREYYRQLETAAGRTPGLEMQVTAYDKAFFSSTVKTELVFSLFKSAEEETPSMVFQSDIQHGPLILFGKGSPAFQLLTSESRIVQTTGAWAGLLETVPELKQLISNDRISYSWGYENRTEFPAVDRDITVDGETLQLQTAALTAELTGRLQPEMTLRGTLSMPGGSFRVPGEQLQTELKEINMEFDMRQVLETLYAGTSTMKVGTFSLQGEGHNALSLNLKDLEVAAVIDIVDGMLREKISYRFDKLLVNEDLYGPAVLELALGNLDAQILADFQQELQSVQTDLLTPQPDPLVAQQVVEKMKALALPLLKKSPKFEVTQLNVATPFGTLDSKGQVHIDGDKVIGIDPPMLLIAALAADADLSVDKGLLRQVGQLFATNALKKQGLSAEQAQEHAPQQAQAQIDGLVAANILVDTGEAYRLQAKFDNGAAYVNGKRMQ